MKNQIFLSLITLSTLLFSGCEKVIELDIPSSEPVVIIESRISSDTALWSAKLSWSQPVFQQGERKNISNALVIISDNFGGVDTLVHQDTGLYVSKTKRFCLVNRVYTIEVKHEGKTYYANEKCKDQRPISFLMSFELPVRNGFIDPGFYVFEKAEEIEAPGDFYLWKVYRNDSLQEDFGYLIETDEFRETLYFNINIDPDDPLKDMDKNILPRPFPVQFQVGDVARIEQHAITKEYYDFLLELQTQVSRSGTPFDPPPANPKSNLKGGAYGYFSVTNVSKASIVVAE